MSTMPASHGHSEACCNIPPVVTKGYEAKGTYKDIGGYKTYVTGPVDAKKAIVVIYDIFGYFEQTYAATCSVVTRSINKPRVYFS